MGSTLVTITSGDPDGIGLEVTVKALLAFPKSKKTVFIIYKKINNQNSLIKKLNTKFNVHVCSSFPEEIPLKKNLVVIESTENPTQWVEEAINLQLKKKTHALVTAPLSKQRIKKDGFKDIGHTEIIKRLCKTKQAYMGFIGKHFHVVLATGHLPLSQISKSLNSVKLIGAFKAAKDLQKMFLPNLKKIALVGLNPHASDNGIIGNEENIKLKPFSKKYGVIGPLIPDVAFMKNNWKKHPIYIACYHDQGLIPFKLVHGFDFGCHITLGVPIVRTSVDHGTAKDIFGKNKANYKSMKSAIEWAIKASKSNIR